MPQKPIDFIPESPIDFQPDPGPGLFEKFNNLWINQPITKAPSRFFSKLAEPLIGLSEDVINRATQKDLPPQYGADKSQELPSFFKYVAEPFRLYGTYAKGIGESIDSFLTPLNLGSLGTGELATATTQIAPKLSNLAKWATRASAAPVAVQGGYDAYNAESLPEKLGGLATFGMGVLGTRFKPDNVSQLRSLDSVKPEELQFGKHILGGPSVDEIAESLRPAAQMGAFTDVSRRLPAIGESSFIEPPNSRFVAGKYGIADKENLPPIDITDYAKFKDREIVPHIDPITGEPDPGFSSLAPSEEISTSPGDANYLAQDKLFGISPKRFDPATENPVFDALVPNRFKPQEPQIDFRPDGSSLFNRFDDTTGARPGTSLREALGSELPRERNIPNETGLFDEPSFMRVPGVKSAQGIENIAMGGASPRVLDVLGNSLYSTSGPTVTTKELLQNAFDEHRTSGQTGPIRVVFHRSLPNDERAITIKDNGRGLTPEQLYTKFTDVGETGKADDPSASGGFGFAKAAPMLSGTRFRAESVILENGEKVKYTFKGTPSELKNQDVGVELKREVVDPNTPTGLTATTYYPKDKSLYEAEEYAQYMTENSPSITSDVIVSNNYGSEAQADVFLGNKKSKFDLLEGYTKSYTKLPEKQLIDTINLPGSKIDLRYNDPTGIDASDYNLHIRNKGLYQKTLSSQYYGDTIPNAPKDIIADINALVEEGHDDYPFTANREQLNTRVRDSINEWIQKNIVSGSLEKKRNQIQRAYDSILGMPTKNTARKAAFFDSGNRLTPLEVEQFKNSPVLNDLIYEYDQTISNILHRLGQDEVSNRLEGVGVGLLHGGDDGSITHGLHIPNPTTGKSTILINPFEHIALNPDSPGDAAFDTLVTLLHEPAHIGKSVPNYAPINAGDLKDPRVGKYLASYLQHTMEQGGLNAAHNIGFVKRLGEIYARYGAKRSFETIDRITSIISDESGGYNPEIQRLLQVYQDARGRTATTEDILSRTGVKQADRKRSGKGNISSNNSTDGNGDAISRLRAAIAAARPIRETQEQLYSQERGKKFSEAAKIRATGFGSVIKKLGKLKGELPKADYSPIKLAQKDVDTLTRLIFSQPALQEGEKIRAAIALGKIVGKTRATGVPQRGELALLETVLGKETVGEIRELYAGLGTLPYEGLATDIVNIPKSLMSSSDLSAPLRQGIGMVTMPEFWTSFDDMFKSFGSQKAYDGVMASIDDKMLDIGRRLGMPATDAHMVAKRIGLSLTDLSENLNMREESAMSRLTGKLPWVKSANRAYVAFLNKLRVDSFDSLLKGMESWYGGAKQDEVAIKELARFINGATGRGSLDFSKTPVVGKFLGDWEDSAANLNNIFFSPRLIASRVQGLNPWNYVNPEIPGYIRLQYLRSLAGVAGIGSLITGLAYVGGATVDDNPTSADFGKAKIGNTRIDPYGGFQQYIVAFNRLTRKEMFSTTTGRTNRLNTGRFNAPTRGDVTERFGRSKLNPIVGFAWDIYTGKDMGGNPVEVTPALANLFIPMIVNDTYQLIQEQPELFGANAVAAAIALGSLGVGTQTYNRPNVGQDVMAGLEQAPPYRTRFSNNGPGPLYDMIQGQ